MAAAAFAFFQTIHGICEEIKEGYGLRWAKGYEKVVLLSSHYSIVAVWRGWRWQRITLGMRLVKHHDRLSQLHDLYLN